MLPETTNKKVLKIKPCVMIVLFFLLIGKVILTSVGVPGFWEGQVEQ